MRLKEKPSFFTDTDDILYITANSASGSKYYDIQEAVAFPYAAVKSQEKTPTYSEVSVSEAHFTITTYRTNDGSVLDTFTINRTVEEEDSDAASSGNVSKPAIRDDAAASTDSTYADVSNGYWASDAIEAATNAGLMDGISSTKFGPEQNTTRGMITTILWRYEGSPAVDGEQFSDVAAGKYYAEAVEWAALNGIVLGYGDNTYGPEDLVTREQLSTILYRYAEYKGWDVSASAELTFSDAAEISAYAVPAVKWAVGDGIINGMGDGTVAPAAYATRAQVAAMLQRFLGL